MGRRDGVGRERYKDRSLWLCSLTSSVSGQRFKLKELPPVCTKTVINPRTKVTPKCSSKIKGLYWKMVNCSRLLHWLFRKTGMSTPVELGGRLDKTIMDAASHGDVCFIEACLDAGLHPDTRSVFQTCLVHVAAKFGHNEILKLLISRGADVNALDYVGGSMALNSH